MSEMFLRTEMMLGKSAMEKLKNARVAIFGVGGVGGYVFEALVRSGVGEIDVFDRDAVSESNLNRQILAVQDTLGTPKVLAAKERGTQINPDVKINAHNCFYMPDNADEYDFSKYSYVVDAVDTVTAKIEIIMRAKSAGVPVISSMGTAGKIDASKLEVSDIYKTQMCPLARVMRREMKKRSVKELKVVYSQEEPKSETVHFDSETKKSVPGSVAFVPGAAGLIMAGEVIKDLIK